MNPTRHRLYEQITEWFYESGAIDSVYHLYTRFLRYIKYQKLNLNVTEDRLWKSFCEATCTLRKAYIMGSTHGITRKYSSSRPQDWKEEYEEYWKFILEDLFPTDTVNSLFDSIPIEAWEEEVRNWREVLGCFLPEYIQPSYEILEQFGYITRENDEWISYEDAEWND